MTLYELFVKISGDSSSYKKSIKEAEGATQAFASMAGAAGVKISGALGLAGLGVAAIKAAEDLEHAGFRMQRMTGATGAALDEMNKSLKAVYAQTSRSAEEVAGALSELRIRTGESGKELEALTMSAIRFAKVTYADLGSSVKASQQLFASWAVATDDQSAALDMLFVAQQKSGIATEALTAGLIATGPALRNLGFNFTESVALVSSFHKAGLDASEMVMGLNKAFVAFAAAGKDPKAALQDLIEKMANAETRTEALNLAMAAGFAARTAGKFVDAVLKGTFSLDELTKALKLSEGQVKKTAEETTQLSDVWKKLSNNFSLLVEGPGKHLLHFLDGLVELLQSALKTGKALVDLDLSKLGGKFVPEKRRTFFQGREVIDSSALFAVPIPKKFSSLEVSSGGAAGIADEEEKKKTIHGRAFGDVLGDLKTAVIVEQYNQAISARRKFITDWIKGDVEIRAHMMDLWAGLTDIPPFMTGEMAPAMGLVMEKGQNMAEIFEEIGKAAISMAKKALSSSPWGLLSEGMDQLGLTSERQYKEMADTAAQAYSDVLESSASTMREQERAWAKAAEAMIMYQRMAGEITVREWAARIEDIRKYLETLGHELPKLPNKGSKAAGEMGREWKKAYDNMRKGMADALWDGGKVWENFGDKAMKVLKELAKGITEVLIGKALKALGAALMDMSGLFKSIGGWLGVGSSAASTATKGAGAGAGGVGGAVGAVGAGASGAMGIIGAAASVGTMISSIIGNFQSAKMETTLNAIEHSTRYSMLYLGDRADGGILGILFRINEVLSWGPGVKAIEDLRNKFVDWAGAGGTVSGGGGRGNATFQFYNCSFSGTSETAVSAMMDAAFRKLALAQG